MSMKVDGEYYDGLNTFSQRKWIEECYDGLDRWKGWMTGAGQEVSRQLKWKVNREEEVLGLVG